MNKARRSSGCRVGIDVPLVRLRAEIARLRGVKAGLAPRS
jgi:hypothetical protein